MYLLGFPQTLTEVGMWLTFAILVISFWAAVTKLPLGQKIFKNNVTDPLSHWIETRVVQATAPQRDKQNEFEKYVKFHLGPNGETPPIHERIKNLEKDSVIGEIRQRRFMDNIDVMIAESGPDGETHFVNIALCKIMECDAEDWYGEGWKNFIDPAQLTAEVERWESVLANQGTNPFHLLTLITKKTKKHIHTKARGYPIHASGELIGYVGEMYPLDEEEYQSFL